MIIIIITNNNNINNDNDNDNTNDTTNDNSTNDNSTNDDNHDDDNNNSNKGARRVLGEPRRPEAEERRAREADGRAAGRCSRLCIPGDMYKTYI